MARGSCHGSGVGEESVAGEKTVVVGDGDGALENKSDGCITSGGVPKMRTLFDGLCADKGDTGSRRTS